MVGSGFSNRPRIPESSQASQTADEMASSQKVQGLPGRPAPAPFPAGASPDGTSSRVRVPPGSTQPAGLALSQEGRSDTPRNAKRKVTTGRAWEDRQTQSPPAAQHICPRLTASTVLQNFKGPAGCGGWSANPGLGSRACSESWVSDLHFGPQLPPSEGTRLAQTPGRRARGGLGQRTWSGQATGQDGAGGGLPDRSGQGRPKQGPPCPRASFPLCSVRSARPSLLVFGLSYLSLGKSWGVSPKPFSQPWTLVTSGGKIVPNPKLNK